MVYIIHVWIQNHVNIPNRYIWGGNHRHRQGLAGSLGLSGKQRRVVRVRRTSQQTGREGIKTWMWRAIKLRFNKILWITFSLKQHSHKIKKNQSPISVFLYFNSM